MSSRNVLILQKDESSTNGLHELLAGWDYQLFVSDNIDHAIKLFAEVKPSLVIDDSTGFDTDDFTFVRAVHAHDADIPVVLLADHASVERAVHAIREERVFHYFEKPIDPNKLRIVLDRAVELAEAKRENELLRRQLHQKDLHSDRASCAIVCVRADYW
jgi:two-component system nitrogen regulation response regulator GlnG